MKLKIHTNKKFSDLPKKRYTLFKTGGVNPYMTDLGPVLYLYDNFSERIKTFRVKCDAQYPRCHIEYELNGYIINLLYIFLFANL